MKIPHAFLLNCLVLELKELPIWMSPTSTNMSQRPYSNWAQSSEYQGHKKFENWARNSREIPRSVWDDLAAPSDLDLNQSPGKGHNQFVLEILSSKDTKSLKIGPETAEKSQGQFGTTSWRQVTSTSTNLCVKGIIRLVSKFWVLRTQKVSKKTKKCLS